MTATQEVGLKTNSYTTSTGQKANSVNGQGSIRNLSPNRFEVKRTSGWYDAIDNPTDPLPGRSEMSSAAQLAEYRGDEYDDTQTFYTVNVESVLDLESIQNETGHALNVNFTSGDYGMPTIEILDGDGEREEV